ncbi:FtsX-like permease family protein [Nonomuraea sp. NPDC050404]|uniref:FtsX-like permease family protein n=1 Tax=Nonomuraea sp. NPDC050404 TaxID=3155783 RepID=UPI0033D01488
MWLIARRSFTEGWGRLVTTLLAALFSVGLIAGTLQFALRAQDAVSGSDASEYALADLLVQGGSPDPDDAHAIPDGRVRLDAVAGRPGVAAAVGDAMVPVSVAGADGRSIMPPAGARTLLRPWVADRRLNAYRLEEGRAPAVDGEVAIMRHVADAGGLRIGVTTAVALPSHTRQMKIVGIVSVRDRSAVAAGDLLLAAPETVRQAAGLPEGTWQSIWVKAAEGTETGRLRADLQSGLGGATVRAAAEVRDAQSSSLLAEGVSISGGIGMLTTVAVFVGLFTVANTFGGLIRQRTRKLALLSAIGATPEQVKTLIRMEALVLGAVAAIGGALLGYPVSDALTRLFAIDGFDISVAGPPSAFVVIVPLATGILVTQLAAWRAGRRAADIAPMQALQETTRERPALRRRTRLFVALAIFLTAFLFYGPVLAVLNDSPPGPERTNAISALIVCGSMISVCALAVLGPLFVGPLGGLVGRIGMLLYGEAGRLAHATITRSPQRVSTAASSLMLGVALVTSTALIVISANDRFDEAGAQVMRAEHAVSTTEKTPEGLRPLPRDITVAIERTPGVRHAAALTTTEAKLISPKPRAYNPEEEALPFYLPITGADQKILPEVLDLGGNLKALAPGEIGLTSNLMKAQRLKRGQKIVVRAPNGEIPLTIAGAYHDPSHLFADGAVVSAETMDRLDSTAAAQVVLVNGGDRAALAGAVAGVPGAEVLDRAGFVERASAAITEGMMVIYGFIAMTLLLALFGMATTVSMGVSERRREFGLLGAVGATGGQVRAIVRLEAATVVVLGTVLGLGTAVGTVALIHLATGSSFIRADAPWWVYALVTAGALAMTLATSALPARRAATTPILRATRAG